MLPGLQVNRRFEEGKRFLNVGDRRLVPVLAIGIVKLVFKSNIVVLSECHFCPKFLLNIVSVDLLDKNNYEISIIKNFVISF